MYQLYICYSFVSDPNKRINVMIGSTRSIKTAIMFQELNRKDMVVLLDEFDPSCSFHNLKDIFDVQPLILMTKNITYRKLKKLLEV